MLRLSPGLFLVIAAVWALICVASRQATGQGPSASVPPRRDKAPPATAAAETVPATLRDSDAGTAAAPTGPVDRLIPWLMDEDRQLRGIPWSEVVFDATGKKVIAFDPKNEIDQRIVRAIGVACDETMKRLNEPNSPIQKIERINEVSSYFEDILRELLNSTPGVSCDFPRTAQDKIRVQARSADCRCGQQTSLLFRSQALCDGKSR